ncbi:ABC transporter substrate-binding protein [Burkholderia pyrrocinia]|uniref:ABC transporter substrate-binding protein n=1 Tax=Burkholderia pyrrocinia TaxID=60550 RepID=UPI001BCB28C4|nr:ABC transporter substrate-binding protein [Burkholderia pyrrocinia]QVN23142.1 ABC transporter substrate-binding protein [Burkholderia pyrrocinia]
MSGLDRKARAPRGRWRHAMPALLIAALAVARLACAGELPVGVELPLTGAMARAGNAQLEGIRIAASLFNQRGGKHTVKLSVIDDEAQPAKAVSAVEQLASQRVLAITGGYGSNLVSPASEAADKAGLVYITSGGVDAGMTSRGLKRFFRLGPVSGYVRAIAGLLGEMGAKSVSIVASTKQAPADLARSLSVALAAQGVKVTAHPYDAAMTDFKPIVNKIKLQDRPDVMLMVGYENDYIGILRAAKVLKPSLKAVVGAWALATPKMASEFPDLVDNVYGNAMLPYPVQFASPEGRAFVAAYQRAYRKEPDYLAEFAYVQSMLLFDALARAADKGALTADGVAGELRNRPFDTLIGSVRFDDRGDNPAFVNNMAQIQGGKLAIVWPKARATGSSRYPALPW